VTRNFARHESTSNRKENETEMTQENNTDEILATFDVYSPRWGHTDGYSFHMTREGFSLQLNTKRAECKLNDDRAAVWSGHNAPTGNPLLQIMSDDSIYAPEIVPEALEWVLGKWNRYEAKRETILDALGDLFAWIDHTARAKPSSDFWSEYF
jgi:hypothetical protein